MLCAPYGFHDIIAGCSVNYILHMLNMTHIDWNSKPQTTVKTAMFGSQHVAARTCVE